MCCTWVEYNYIYLNVSWYTRKLGDYDIFSEILEGLVDIDFSGVEFT